MGQPLTLFGLFYHKAYYTRWGKKVLLKWTLQHHWHVIISGFLSQLEGVLGCFVPLLASSSENSTNAGDSWHVVRNLNVQPSLILIEMFESKYQKQQQNARKDGAKLCRSEIIKLCDLMIQRPLYQMFVAATIWSLATVTMLFQNVAKLLGLYPRPSGLGFLLYLWGDEINQNLNIFF